MFRRTLVLDNLANAMLRDYDVAAWLGFQNKLDAIFRVVLADYEYSEMADLLAHIENVLSNPQIDLHAAFVMKGEGRIAYMFMLDKDFRNIKYINLLIKSEEDHFRLYYDPGMSAYQR